jgi:hypothetical protein
VPRSIQFGAPVTKRVVSILALLRGVREGSHCLSVESRTAH